MDKKIMEKIKQLNLNFYICVKCNRIHRRKFKNRDSKIYIEHFNERLSDKLPSQTEIYLFRFSKSCDNYTIKKHKKTQGSKKQ